MPLPAPANRRLLHDRAVTYRGYEREDGLWDLEAELVDTKDYPITMFERGELPPGTRIHGMLLRVTVDDDFVIRAIATSMDDTPLPECVGARDPMQAMVGVTMGRGWRQAIDRALGGTRGCAHLRELLFNLATLAFQTIPAGQLRRQGQSTPPQPVDGQPPFHLGSCHTWDVDGPAVARHYPQFAGWAPLRRAARDPQPCAVPEQPGQA